MAGIAATYVDSDTFTVVDNQTAVYMEGRRVKCNCVTDGYKYGTIASSSYSTPNTTVNLTSGSDNLTSNLTTVWFGIIGKSSTQSLPNHDHSSSEGSGGELGSYGTSDHSELNELDYASAGHTGQLSIGEYDIKLEALLSADGKYSGTTRDGVLGATLAYGDLVYLNTTDQRWELADADAETTSGDVDLAIVLAGGDDGDTRLLLIDGFVREDDWNFTSYGQALFVSVTAGDITQTAPSASGDIVRVVGKAGTTADQIRFKPSETWIELS